MAKRLAVTSIIIEDVNISERVNNVLHEFNEFIVGRMGIPYREKKVSIISVIIDAEEDIINNLTGKLGMIKGISASTKFAKI